MIAGNLAWVAGSVLALAECSPTALGYAFVVAQAVVVAGDDRAARDLAAVAALVLLLLVLAIWQ